MAILELSMVTGAIVEMNVEAIAKELGRRETIIRILKRLKMDSEPAADDFDAVYAYTLVEYGVSKPEPILNFFRNEFVREAFRQSFYKNDPSILEKEAEGIIQWNEETGKLGQIDYDPRCEFAAFTAVFNEIVDRTRTPAEVKRDQKLGDLHQSTGEILERLDRLDALEDIRSELARLVREQDEAIAVRSSQMLDGQTYLETIIRKYEDWENTYTDLAASITLPALRLPKSFVSTGLELLREMSFGDQYKTIERIRFERVQDVLDRYPKIVLLGEPGSGKTTTLWRIALKYARRALQNQSSQWPVFLDLSTWTPFASVEEWIQTQPDSPPDLGERLATGSLLLLFDALNEMPKSQHVSNVELLRGFVNRYPLCRYVFTCRKLDYDESLGLQQVEIEPLNRLQIEEFINNYIPDMGSELVQTLESNYQDLLELASNPYYLMLIVWLYGQLGSNLPRNRGQLFSGVVDVLLRRELKRSRSVWDQLHLSPSQFKDLLSKLAFEMHKCGKGTVVERVWAEEVLRAVAPSYPEGRLLYLSASASLISLGEGRDLLRFRHQRLQEFFSSLELRRRVKCEQLDKFCQIPLSANEDMYAHRTGEPLPPPATTGWEETIAMMASIQQDSSKLIRQISSINPLLAGYCLTDGQASTSSEAQAEVKDRLLGLASDQTISLRVRVSAGHLLGQLGDPRLKDKSINEQRVILPPMVEVPSGKYWIGAVSSEGFYPDEVPRHQVELTTFAIGKFPITNVEFECFIAARGYNQKRYWSDAGWAWRCGRMDKELRDSLFTGYLAVREQCRQERERLEERLAQDSTEMDVWWKILFTPSDSGAVDLLREVCEAEWEKSHDHPAYWDDPAFNRRNQPVIVTWFEANAYCRWLSSITGREFRLPTEFEWEVASRGNLEQEYTWTGGWDSANLNALEGSILSTSPIGVFPGGLGVFGTLDMLGNVWEWTSSLKQNYPYSEQDAGDTSLYSDARRVVRGGSWAVTKPNARCSCRGNFPVDNLVRNYLGFRLCSGVVG